MVISRLTPARRQQRPELINNLGGPIRTYVNTIQAHMYSNQVERQRVVHNIPFHSQNKVLFGGLISFLLNYCLGVFLSSELGVGICHTDGELFCSLNNLLSDSGRNGMGNSGGISTVVHHEHLQFVHIVDYNGLESVGVDVTGLLVRSVTNARHRNSSLESTANTSINTLRLAPGRVSNSDEEIGLVASELL